MSSKLERNPLAQIIELLGTKWVLRIIWELRLKPLTFRELQSSCGNLSPTVLNQRLKLLEEACLIEKKPPAGYALTTIAEDLTNLYEPLKHWASLWVEYQKVHRPLETSHQSTTSVNAPNKVS